MPPKKDKPAGWNFNPIEGIIVLLFFAAILGSFVTSVTRYLTSGELTFYGFKLAGIFEFFKSNVLFFQILGYVAAFAAAVATFIYTKRADALWREMKANVYPANMKMLPSDAAPAENPMLTRWQKIVALSQSQNTSDWRLAIIEADVILDELLDKLQLPGDTIGEKLKAVEKSDFTTVESAWEAHKARNNIAHEGEGFLLNQREVARIIFLYEAVFKEFSLI